MIPEEQMGNLRNLFLTNILNGGTGSSFHLFTNNVLLSPTIALADLDEATFDGYSAQTSLTTWFEGTDPFTGRAMDILQFTPTDWAVGGDTDLPQVIYGWYVVSETGLLAHVSKLKQPIPVTAEGQLVRVDPSFMWNVSFQDSVGSE